jgi:hypothetical protein
MRCPVMESPRYALASPSFHPDTSPSPMFHLHVKFMAKLSSR